MKEENKKNMKKIKNIISDETSKENNDFDILFLVDATGSMSSYITAAKEETKVVAGENLLLSLTDRENEVLDLLTQGINYKSIAQKLIISETTVKTHVNNIFQKLQVNDRTNAVLYALTHGFKPSSAQETAMTTAA